VTRLPATATRLVEASIVLNAALTAYTVQHSLTEDGAFAGCRRATAPT
jgi:hypothetical protein